MLCFVGCKGPDQCLKSGNTGWSRVSMPVPAVFHKIFIRYSWEIHKIFIGYVWIKLKNEHKKSPQQGGLFSVV